MIDLVRRRRRRDTIDLLDLEKYIKAEYNVLNVFGTFQKEFGCNNSSFVSVDRELFEDSLSYLEEKKDEEDVSDALKVYRALIEMMDKQETPEEFLLLVWW